METTRRLILRWRSALLDNSRVNTLRNCSTKAINLGAVGGANSL